MNSATLYGQLASHYQNAIEAGSLLVGDRMPSLRVLMERHDVSLSTALNACRHLETTGWLEARPRSGYFVRSRRKSILAPNKEPADGLPDPAQYVGINQHVSAIVARGQKMPVTINLAGACGAPQLYPTDALKQGIIRALRHQPDLFGHPGPRTANGDPAFRAAMARNALTSGIKLSADDIVVTHGCIEALNLALRAVTQPGDVVAVESPTFFGLLQILESLGLQALEIPSSPITGISLEALELAGQTYANIKAVVVVPNLQNPLGSVMPDSHKASLVQWCESRKIPLIEDDTYSALSDSDVPLAALKAWDETGNVIHCASMHKILAPGMRLGWIAAGKWQSRVEMLKYAQSRSNEVLPQIAVAEYMESGAYERHLRRLRTTLRNQREQVAEAIANYFPPGTRLSLPRGGLALWVEMPGNRSSEQLFHQALNEGIRIAPGLMFSNSNRFNHYLRISCGAPYTAELERGLRRLAVLVAELP